MTDPTDGCWIVLMYRYCRWSWIIDILDKVVHLEICTPLRSCSRPSISRGRDHAAPPLLHDTVPQPGYFDHLVSRTAFVLFGFVPGGPRLHPPPAWGRSSGRPIDSEQGLRLLVFPDHHGSDFLCRYCLVDGKPSLYRVLWRKLLPSIILFFLSGAGSIN